MKRCTDPCNCVGCQVQVFEDLSVTLCKDHQVEEVKEERQYRETPLRPGEDIYDAGGKMVGVFVTVKNKDGREIGRVATPAQPDKEEFHLSCPQGCNSIPHKQFPSEAKEEKWQPEIGENFFSVGTVMHNDGGIRTYEQIWERSMRMQSHHFKTKEHAEEAAKRMKETLEEYHKDLKY